MSSPVWKRRRRWKHVDMSTAWVWKVAYNRGRYSRDEAGSREAPDWYPTKESFWRLYGAKVRKAQLRRFQDLVD